MKRLAVIAALVLAGCASQERMIPVGSTVVADTTGGKGPDVFSTCTKEGNLLFLSKEKGGPVLAIAGGCKTPEPVTPPATPPAEAKAMQLQLPTTIQIQMLPPPEAKPAPAAQLMVVPLESRGLLRIDPNTASADDLERLPGISYVESQAIIRNRPYRSLQELVDKKALSAATLQANLPYLTIR